MKKVLLFCVFSASALLSFAASAFSAVNIEGVEAMNTEVEAIPVEPACVPTTFSCGESSVVCGSDLEELLLVIKIAEDHYCGD